MASMLKKLVGAALFSSLALPLAPSLAEYNKSEPVEPAKGNARAECLLGDMSYAALAAIGASLSTNARVELQRSGVDWNRGTPISQLEVVLGNAMPYAASVLGASRVFRPKISLVNGGKIGDWDIRGNYRPENGTAGIDEKLSEDASRDSLYEALPEYLAAHELVHAQHSAKFLDSLTHNYLSILRLLSAGNITAKNRFLDETFTEVAAAELLARQALDGNNGAKNALGHRVRFYFDRHPNSQKPLDEERDRKYRIDPAAILKDSIICRNSEYRGLKLYSIRDIVQRQDKWSYGFFSRIGKDNPK